MTGWLRRTVAGAIGVVLLAGCGSSSTPADEVPELAEQLGSVDQALVDEDYAQAGEHLRELVTTTEEARASGTLEDGEADRVLAAAAQLLAELPEPVDETLPEETPPPAEDDPEGGAGEGDGLDEESKKAEEEERKQEAEARKDKEKKDKEDQGSGTGDSSGNGPDDGHGH